MLYQVLFALVSIIGIAAAASIFVLKDILHAGVALATVFLANSLIFILLNQPLLAVVQLFIMVGGIVTFIFVGVASATYSNFKYTRIIPLIVLWLVLFAVMAVPLGSVSFGAQQSNVFGASDIAASLGGSISIFYLMMLVLFGVSLGAILLLKKAGARK